MTMAPPDGRLTWREYADSIWCSIWKREKKRHVVAVTLDSIDRRRHDVRHELAPVRKTSSVSIRISPMSGWK